MKVIGIVGGIGAGKTTVVGILTELMPTFVIGVDEIGHEILMPEGEAYQEVVETFGEEILDEGGFIIRRKLGEIVFKNPEALQKLNAITHPKMYTKIQVCIKKCEKERKYEWVIIDAALLIEIGLVKLTDCIIGVYAEEKIRLERIMKRENFSYDEALSRIKAQKKWEELEKITHEVVDNSSSYEYTKEQIDKIIATW